MAPLDNPALPKGSLVLVTGATGFVGSCVADQFLAFGFKVRGTTRDTSKGAWLQKAFDDKYGPGQFELVSVVDMVADGAYDQVVKGVDAVAHTASNMTMNPDPNVTIPSSISGAINALEAAYAEPSVKRFVFTSSSAAAVVSLHGLAKVIITPDTWNELAVKEAWADPPYEPSRTLWTYGASKTQAEQAIWKYHQENRSKRPDLVVNTVLPNMVYGPPVDPVNQGFPSSVGFIAALYNGERRPLHDGLAPQYFINSEDQGILHVAAAIHPDVKDERIFGFAGRYNWDMILDILRKIEPERTFPDNFDGGEDPNEVLPAARAEQLLKDLGRPGWKSLEDSVRQVAASLRKLEAA